MSGHDDYEKMEEKEEEKVVDHLKAVEFPAGKRFGDWWIVKKIDEGEYGIVYSVKDGKSGKMAALKAESNTLEGGSALKLEGLVLREINKTGPVAHVPEVFAAVKRRKYCYMVMTLLGPDLRHLLKKCNNKFTRGTWSRVGLQCLYAIKLLHDHGFVHRHIKPRNFLLGAPNDTKRARVVHIIDFGLARPFAYFNRQYNCWCARRARSSASFRGDFRYTSSNAELYHEQGRVDDLWSLVYMLIEMNGSLPWKAKEDVLEMATQKRDMPWEELIYGMPSNIYPLKDVLEKCDYYQFPDYNFFAGLLIRIMNSEKASPLTKYDWEEREVTVGSQLLFQNRVNEVWEDVSFFKKNPLRINQKEDVNADRKPLERNLKAVRRTNRVRKTK